MVERARGLTGVLRERQRSLAQALDAAADADVVSTLEAEGARLAEELEATEIEAVALAPEQEALVRAEEQTAAELESHLLAWGDGAELAGPTRRSRWPGASSPRSSTDSSVTGARWTSSRCARPRPNGGPRCSRARTTSSGSAWPRRSRPAISCRPRWPRPRPRTVGPPAGSRRPRGPCARPSTSTTGRWPAPTPSSGRSTRPGGRPVPNCCRGWTGSSGSCSTSSRSTRAGRTPSRRPPGRRWRPWSCRAACRPRPPWPACARVGPRVRCSPSPTDRRPRPRRRSRPAPVAGDRVDSPPCRVPVPGAADIPGWRRRSIRLLVRSLRRSGAGPRPSTWPWPDPIWSWSPAGDRFSPPGGGCGPAAASSPRRWSTRPGPGPRRRRRPRPRRPRSEPGHGSASSRPGRPPWRRSAPTTGTRSPIRRPACPANGWPGDRVALAAELEEIRRTMPSSTTRITRDTARAASLRQELPVLERAGRRRPGGRRRPARSASASTSGSPRRPRCAVSGRSARPG